MLFNTPQAQAFLAPDTVALNSYWFAPRMAQDKPLYKIPGSTFTGDHGDQYQFEKPSPAKYKADLNCGCSLYFPVQTTDGEMLYCARHEDWFKSHIEKPKKLPEVYFAECKVCPTKLGPYSSRAIYRKAKKHCIGPSGNKNPIHPMRIGRELDGTIQWKDYVYEGVEKRGKSAQILPPDNG